MNFLSQHKKFFLISGFLILVAILGYLIWKLFFSSPTQTLVTPATPGTINGLPTAGTGSSTNTELTGSGNLPNQGGASDAANQNEPNSLAVGGLTKTQPLTTDPTLNPTLTPGGGVQYYNTNDGHFYKIDNNGKISLLSDKVFYNVKDIVWAPNKNQAVLEYPDGRKILYNFQTQKQVTLPSYWQDFSFSPTSDQITSKSLGLDPENNWLIVSNADGSQAKTLENIGTNDKTVYPAWSPNKQIVAVYTQGVDFNRQEVFFVGLNGENFKSTIIEGRGFNSQWSTTGDRLLYSVYNTATNLNPELWIVDAQGDSISQNRQDLGLATWNSKCTFSSNTEVYCAVPENLPQGAGLFPELADQTKDNLYKINLETGTKELIAIPDGAYNISSVMVPTDNSNLYFTDKTTNQIYQIKLR
ncbi:MAG: hypothetical protein WC249_04375 [Patescibacteria group bacterium]|jgi:hypothetical protein